MIRSDAASQRETPDSAVLLAWYDRHRRNLPWRSPPGMRPDPYRVWLSEIMLQQTTVATVGPYFDRFMARWPDISALAAASLGEVLWLWQGLGYYARARNLHACARAVVDPHDRIFPDEIETLPAFSSSLAALAAALVPEQRTGYFAQALMDLGATICTPRRPRCVLCPWRACCAAVASGSVEDFPARTEKPARPLRHGVAFWLTRTDGAVLLRRRPEKGLLGGMIEIPSTPWRAAPWTLADAVRVAPVAAAWSPLPGIVRHGFTHFLLELAVVAGSGIADGIWSPVDRLGEHALPTLMKKLARHAVAALVANPYEGAISSASNNGSSPSAASRTGANESR